MTKMFTKAPLIAHVPGHGVWAEGSRNARAKDLVTFELGVASYGFLVAPGERLTGSQWLARIERTFGREHPRNREVLAAISQVMLTADWSDDYVLFDPNGQPVLRSTLQRCKDYRHLAMRMNPTWAATARIEPAEGVQVTREQLEAAEAATLNMALAGTGAKLVSQAAVMPQGYAIAPGQGVLEGVVPRGWELCRPISAPGGRGILDRQIDVLRTSTPAGGADLGAQLQVALDLTRHAGYSFGYAWRPRGMALRSASASLGNEGSISMGELQQSLASFVRDLLDAGWSPSEQDNPLRLGRPAPIVNPQLAVRQFEHLEGRSGVIGWRLPATLVQELVRQARETAKEGDTAGAAVERMR